MPNVFDVAKYILSRTGKISTWKLQKLCYYAQAWSLAWTGRPLFAEDFQAWSNGPVCPELFRQHKGMFFIDYNDLTVGDEKCLSDDQVDTINVVLQTYKDMEPYDLRQQTHSEAPWKDARGDCPDGAYCQNVISKESMGEYYGSL